MASKQKIRRREFLSQSSLAMLGLQFPIARGVAANPAPATPGSAARVFRLWVFSDTHVGTDLKNECSRESLAEAIRQSENGGSMGGPAFEWDVALALGDFSGNFGPPDDAEGMEVVRQFGALQKHSREDIFPIAGNHDATRSEEQAQWWFRKWLDPMGENPRYSGVDNSKRKYPVTGSWERYSFRVGNILFLMMSDRNDLPAPVGRGVIDASKQIGGYPAGAVTSETCQWWQEKVEANSDSIVVSAHHHMLKNTTTASGPWGGFDRNEDGTLKPTYHGYNPDGAPIGASYLYFVDDKPDAQFFEGYLQKNPGSADFWLGAHTHVSPARNPDDKEYLERKWGTTFINCAALSRFHGAFVTPPTSRLITFEEGSDTARVQYYLHTNDFYFQGWYAPLERIVPLKTKFTFDAATESSRSSTTAQPG